MRKNYLDKYSMGENEFKELHLNFKNVIQIIWDNQPSLVLCNLNLSWSPNTQKKNDNLQVDLTAPRQKYVASFQENPKVLPQMKSVLPKTYKVQPVL